MARFPITAAIAATGAAAVQVPLQNPLMNPSLVQEPIEYEKLPLVDSEVLQERISSWNLEARSQVLYQIAQLSQEEYNHPTRVIGSKGHNGTLSYITSTLSQLDGYYDVWDQTFPAVTGNVFESRLVIGDELPKTASTFSLTPATKDKEPVHGNVVLVGADGCEAGDYPEELKGNIALIKRGTCPFGTKSELAGKAGAKAAVVYNTDPEELHGTLGTPSPDHVATFGIGSEEAAKYIKQLKDGEHLDAIAYVDAEVNTIMTTNILAQTKGGDQENCVMLGGHSDSVPEGPGINDDGSGSLSLLELAIQLSSFQVNNCVRFAWWSAEEEGLLGSNYYVSTLEDDENLKIRLFMDYDMMGSPNFAYQIYNATNAENPQGSEELKQLYIDWYESKGLNYTFIPFDGRSDYDGFIRNGIPGGGIATGAEGIKTEDEVEMFGGKAGDWYDPCYHQLCDGTDNVNLTAWEVNTKLIAHSVATYALSFKDFPERTLDAEMEAYAAKTKYRGPKLIL